MNLMPLHRRNPRGDVQAWRSQTAPGHFGAGELEGLAKMGSQLGSHRNASTEGTLKPAEIKMSVCSWNKI